MAGLFDYEDPESAGRLAFAAGLLNASGPQRMPVSFGQALAQAFMGQQQASTQAAMNRRRNALTDAQIMELQAHARQREETAAAAQREAARIAGIRQLMAGAQGPMEINAAALSRAGANPAEIKQLLESINYDPNPVKHWAFATPPGQQNPVMTGFPSSGPPRYTEAGKPPDRPLVNIVNPADKPWLEPIIKTVQDSAAQARGAVNSIGILNNMRNAIEAGVIAGPGATGQQMFTQIAAKMGVAGKDDVEKLKNTRQLIQSAAQVGLEGAKMLQGQGQVSNYERQAVEKASAGNIESMTVFEWKSLVSALEKVNRAKIEQHQGLMKRLPPDISSYSGFFDVQAPQPMAPFSPDTTEPTPATRNINRPPVNWPGN